jgi:predicted DNA-binding transcriptional regulator AlpA
MSSVTAQEDRKGTGEQPLLLLSPEALAGCRGFSPSTIRRLRSAGKLTASLRIGGSVRWRSQGIEAWIEAGCPDAGAWEARKCGSVSLASR